MFKKIFNKKPLSFNKMFPAISPYIHEVKEQNVLMNNVEFVNKYNKYSNTINFFMLQITVYFSDEEIRHIIDKYIIPLNGEQLLKLMTNYLNLSLEDKLSKQYFRYYDDAHDMVEVNDVEANEEKTLDQQFTALCGNKSFNNVKLSALYKDLDYPCKRYLVSLLKNEKCFIGFVELFDYNYRIYFKSLLKILINKSIDASILNYDITNYLGESIYREMVLTLMTNNNLEIARYVKVLIANNEYESIYGLAVRNLLSDNVFKETFGLAEDKTLTDKEIIKTFEKVKVKRNMFK